MSGRPDWKVLSDLVEVAVAILLRPATAFAKRAALDLLAVEVAAAQARPAATTRTVDAAAVMLVTTLRTVIDAPTGERMQWEMVGGALLPIVRRRAFEAVGVEREEAREK